MLDGQHELQNFNRSVAMLLAGIALIPHVLMIFWVIHKLLSNIQCFRRTVAVFMTSTACSEREGAWNIYSGAMRLCCPTDWRTPETIENSQQVLVMPNKYLITT